MMIIDTSIHSVNIIIIWWYNIIGDIDNITKVISFSCEKFPPTWKANLKVYKQFIFLGISWNFLNIHSLFQVNCRQIGNSQSNKREKALQDIFRYIFVSVSIKPAICRPKVRRTFMMKYNHESMIMKVKSVSLASY